jgi:hypothetical protein
VRLFAGVPGALFSLYPHWHLFVDRWSEKVSKEALVGAFTLTFDKSNLSDVA